MMDYKKLLPKVEQVIDASREWSQKDDDKEDHITDSDSKHEHFYFMYDYSLTDLKMIAKLMDYGRASIEGVLDDFQDYESRVNDFVNDFPTPSISGFSSTVIEYLTAKKPLYKYLEEAVELLQLRRQNLNRIE